MVEVEITIIRIDSMGLRRCRLLAIPSSNGVGRDASPSMVEDVPAVSI
jgi:hypothetical protein